MREMEQTERIELRMLPEEKIMLDRLAKSHMVSHSELVRMLIRDAINRKFLVLSVPGNELWQTTRTIFAQAADEIEGGER